MSKVDELREEIDGFIHAPSSWRDDMLDQLIEAARQEGLRELQKLRDEIARVVNAHACGYEACGGTSAICTATHSSFAMEIVGLRSEVAKARQEGREEERAKIAPLARLLDIRCTGDNETRENDVAADSEDSCGKCHECRFAFAIALMPAPNEHSEEDIAFLRATQDALDKARLVRKTLEAKYSSTPSEPAKCGAKP